MSYSDLLRDPRWQRMRLEVMQRADFACEECGDKTTTLNVHHTYYAPGRKPWEYEPESLRCLCERCHELVTQLLDETRRTIGALKLEELDMVIGSIRMLMAVKRGESIAKIESMAQARGAAGVWGVLWCGHRALEKMVRLYSGLPVHRVVGIAVLQAQIIRDASPNGATTLHGDVAVDVPARPEATS
jgi:hypothetical protein